MYLYFKDDGPELIAMTQTIAAVATIANEADAIIQYDSDCHHIIPIRLSGKLRMREYVLALLDFSMLIEQSVVKADGWKA